MFPNVRRFRDSPCNPGKADAGPLVDIAQYGSLSTSSSNSTSIFAGNVLDPPILNITIYTRKFSYYDMKESKFSDELNVDSSHMAWTFANRTYSVDYVREYGRCQTSEVRPLRSCRSVVFPLTTSPELQVGLFIHTSQYHDLHVAIVVYRHIPNVAQSKSGVEMSWY